MSMDPWFLLQCSSCRATLRIKSAYVHMQGKCPVCGYRIEAPQPKPLTMSDSDEPLGLLPKDEVWPEPATVISTLRESTSSTSATYGVNKESGASPSVSKPHEEEEESGGVYTLAFDPNDSRTPGITRSAEWDQGKVAAPVSIAPAIKEPVVSITKSKLVTAPLLEPQQNVVIKTEIDPLFGDEVKITVPVQKLPESLAEKPNEPANDKSLAAPLARVATGDELKLHEPISTPSLLDEGQAETPARKKKKKKKTDTEPVEERSSLDKPTEETHMYRLSMAEENRIKLDAAPKSLFFDGVFTFPWEPKNIGPWIWLSIGFIVCFLLFRLIAHVLEVGGMFAPVGAGAIGMASLLLVIFTLSYGCACWSCTITYTAAGSKAVDWATEGWRENVLVFLRIAYYFVIAMMMATPLLVFSIIDIGIYLWLMGTLFVFPAFLFSGMASLTFWNFLHGDVIKKMLLKSHQYLLMFALAVVLFAFAGAAGYFAVQYTWICLIAGPVCAAAWLIYGRLLGRMAYLLQQQPKRKKKKKKKKPTEGEIEDTGVADAMVNAPAVNEKGPREDARGPGGARPV